MAREKPPLTMDAIKLVLTPVHEAIAFTDNDDMTKMGMALDNYMEGASAFSVKMAQALSLQAGSQGEAVGTIMNTSILEAYQEALTAFVQDEIQPIVRKIGALTGRDSARIKERCEAAYKVLSELTIPQSRSFP